MVELATVDNVVIDEDAKRIWVDVFRGPGRETDRLPFVTTHNGLWIVPEEKQVVEVYTVDDAEGSLAARCMHRSPEHDIPDGLSEGDIAITLNSGTHINLTKNNDGTYNIDIAADGNITIDGIDFDAHTHDYTDIDDTGAVQNKTTDAPN